MDATRINNSKLACRFAATGDVNHLRLLLDSRADVNYQTEKAYTPLMMTAYKGQLPCMQLLMERKANIHLTDHIGWPPLVYAASYGHVECLELLLASNGDVEFLTDIGRTPLIQACQFGRVDCVAFLLDHAGASVHAQDKNGKTAMDQRAVHMHKRKRLVLGFMLHCCGAQVKEEEEKVAFRRVADAVSAYHTELAAVLRSKVIVDARVARKMNGLYHEPLERVLQYCGLDLVMEGDPNIQQDDPIPMLLRGSGRARSAKYWYERFHK